MSLDADEVAIYDIKKQATGRRKEKYLNSHIQDKASRRQTCMMPYLVCIRDFIGDMKVEESERRKTGESEEIEQYV